MEIVRGGFEKKNTAKNHEPNGMTDVPDFIPLECREQVARYWELSVSGNRLEAEQMYATLEVLYQSDEDDVRLLFLLAHGLYIAKEHELELPGIGL